MDGGRSQRGSLLPATARPLYGCALSRVFTAVATLSLCWASQEAPSLQPDLPLAWDGSLGFGRASGDLMIRCHLGEAISLSSRLWGPAPWTPAEEHCPSDSLVVLAFRLAEQVVQR